MLDELTVSDLRVTGSVPEELEGVYGDEVTGGAIYDHLETADGLLLWPGTSPIDCGAEADCPLICSFTFPFAEYTVGGELRTIEGLEALSVLGHLP